VRDSYFVATDGPESAELYEVFLIDEDFRIERPKRAYRTGFHLLTGKGSAHGRKDGAEKAIEENQVDPENPAVRDMLINSGEGMGEKGTALERQEDGTDASHHTFFIVNSQRKLKLVARNARQMHQVSEIAGGNGIWGVGQGSNRAVTRRGAGGRG
jgi:phospholipase D1/2